MANESHTNECVAAKLPDRCDHQTRFDMDAIFANWQFLAAVGWRGYEAEGCGAVVVTVAGEDAGVAYASGAAMAPYSRSVERYHPLEQIVVVVRHQTGEHIYVLNGWPSPRECCETAAVYLESAGVCRVPQPPWEQ